MPFTDLGLLILAALVLCTIGRALAGVVLP
jgi:hypothetical protein